jgi:hypothetical protein
MLVVARHPSWRHIVEPPGHSLTCLSLNQCLQIHTLTLQFKNLGRLSLMGSLDRFSCPALKTLDLSFCFFWIHIHTALTDTQLLEELILVICPALTQLELDRTPLLRILNVNFCHKLHSLRALTTSLELLETSGCTGLEILVMDTTHSCQDTVGAQYIRVTSTNQIRSLRQELTVSRFGRLSPFGQCQSLLPCPV